MKDWRGKKTKTIEVRRERGDGGEGKDTTDGWGKRRSKAVRMIGRSKQTVSEQNSEIKPVWGKREEERRRRKEVR